MAEKRLVSDTVASRASGAEKRCGLFPTVLPLPYGHSVVPGPLTDDTILAKLTATHPFLGVWGRFLRTRLATGTAAINMTNWNAALSACEVPPRTRQWYPQVHITAPPTMAALPVTPPSLLEALWLEAALRAGLDRGPQR